MWSKRREKSLPLASPKMEIVFIRVCAFCITVGCILNETFKLKLPRYGNYFYSYEVSEKFAFEDTLLLAKPLLLGYVRIS